MDGQTDDISLRRFLWGTLLAWTPFLFFLIPALIGFLRAFSTQTATGLTAVAGGYVEALSTFGLVAMLVFEVVAIVLLVRAFSAKRPLRAFLSVISLCCSVLVLTILGFFLRLVFFRLPHS
jgi:hypothetical protein